MKKIKILTLIACGLVFSQNVNAQDAELCFITGAGFYASDGEKSVLLDALMADGLEGFQTASDALNAEMEGAQGRFSNVKMVFASHYHDDHMKGGAILRHLRSNPDAIAIVTKQAFSEFEEAGVTQEEAKRVLIETLEIGAQKELNNVPFPTTLYGISHGEGRPIENIGIAVEVAGKIIMHVGDMNAKLEDLQMAGIDKVEVDYLLMPFWYFNDKDQIDLLAEAFNAKHIVPMHFTLATSDWMMGLGGLDKVKKDTYSTMNGLIELNEEMSCISLND